MKARAGILQGECTDLRDAQSKPSRNEGKERTFAGADKNSPSIGLGGRLSLGESPGSRLSGRGRVRTRVLDTRGILSRVAQPVVVGPAIPGPVDGPADGHPGTAAARVPVPAAVVAAVVRLPPGVVVVAVVVPAVSRTVVHAYRQGRHTTRVVVVVVI
jgi:hypothetical protein